MKKILYTIPIITLIIIGIILIPKKAKIENAYQYMYEANTIISNINYDLDTTWNYYLTDDKFNRTDLTKKISLEVKDMTDETCNLIYTKKIDVILDCITISHNKKYKKAKDLLNKAKKEINSNKDNKNYKDLNKLYELLNDYIELSNYHGDDYKEFNKKYNSLKNDILKLENKFNKIYPVRTDSSM